jgi:selenide,water dikinase
MASEDAVRAMVETMASLNRRASERMRDFEPHACTDITGFGFIGHALEMVMASQVGMVIYSEKIPTLPGAMEYTKMGLVPGGAYSNRDYFSCRVEISSAISPFLLDLLYDPQTSGGLLISLPSREAKSLAEILEKKDQIQARIVGRVVDEPKGKIQIL